MIEFILPAGVAAIVGMALGMFWYSPAFLGRQWMADTGMTPEKMKAAENGVTMPIGTGIGLISQFVRMFVLAWVISLVAPVSIGAALFVGVCVWLGFLMTGDLGGVLWEMGPWRLFFINTAYNLVMMLLGAAIIFYL